MADVDSKLVRSLAAKLREARKVLIITGAGLSADSGLPTYRGVGGLYEEAEPEEGLPIEELLSGEMLAKRPDWTWKYIAQIERGCRGAQPNAGHRAIAALSRQLEECWVLTQNVDGFHRQVDTANLIEIHGNIHDIACTGCDFEDRVDGFAELAIPPSCPRCGALVRPRVVLFGEMLPPRPLDLMRAAVAAQPEVVISVGTSSAFPYIANPVLDACRRGAVTVEINPARTYLSDLVGYHFMSGAAITLEKLVLEAAGDTGSPQSPTSDGDEDR